MAGYALAERHGSGSQCLELRSGEIGEISNRIGQSISLASPRQTCLLCDSPVDLELRPA
jgi:hypothetical protein